MPISNPEPVAGHRAKYDHLAAQMSPEEAGNQFVGGGDPALMGFLELEVLRRFHALKGAGVIDIGCGVGRLAKYLLDEGVSKYLGLDIIPEILQQAITAARNQQAFDFAIVTEAKLPAQDDAFDIVCGFSLITHLLDEEIFEYFLEAKRVLRPGGVAIFSFLDLDVTHVRETFFNHAKVHRTGHGDLLRFTTPAILKYFADGAGFASASFVDGQENIISETRRRKLIDGKPSPDSSGCGQSICVLRT